MKEIGNMRLSHASCACNHTNYIKYEYNNEALFTIGGDAFAYYLEFSSAEVAAEVHSKGTHHTKRARMKTQMRIASPHEACVLWNVQGTQRNNNVMPYSKVSPYIHTFTKHIQEGFCFFSKNKEAGGSD
jgi:hypothetical protein